MPGVKPAVAMKTPSRVFALGLLAVALIIAICSCYNFPIIPDQRTLVTIGSKQGTQLLYVEWTNSRDFKEALQQVCRHRGYYDLFVLLHDGDQHAEHWKENCALNPPASIQTVKVTKSKVASGAAPGDPHVTMKVASAYPGDIIKVLQALATPVPAH